jgi:hypothetical protein
MHTPDLERMDRSGRVEGTDMLDNLTPDIMQGIANELIHEHQDIKRRVEHWTDEALSSTDAGFATHARDVRLHLRSCMMQTGHDLQRLIGHPAPDNIEAWESFVAATGENQYRDAIDSVRGEGTEHATTMSELVLDDARLLVHEAARMEGA